MPLSWIPTGALATVRDAYAATVLQNGKALIIGGLVSFTPDTPTTSCELYDPTANTWSATGSLITARSFFNCVLLNDGKVLAIGGPSGGGGSFCLASCELYDPGTGLWTATGSLAQGRALFGIWHLANNKVLVAGGIPGFALGPSLISSELYDPSTGLWTASGNLAVAVTGPANTVLNDGSALAIGGFTGGSTQSTTSQIYSVGGGTWSLTTGASQYAFGIGGGNNSILLSNNKVLVVAGNPPTAFASGQCQLYDPISQTYTLTGSLAIPRAEGCLFQLNDGRILVAGGDNSGSTCTNTSEIYDVTAGTWSAGPSLSIARATGPEDMGLKLLNGDLLWPAGSDTFSTFSGPSADRLVQTGAPMGIALVQAGGHATIGSQNPPLTVTATTAGNLIVVQTGNTGGATVSSITDNVGNTYVHAPGTNTAGLTTITLWYSENCLAGATTITVHLSSSVNSITSYGEYSGVIHSGALDTGNSTNVSGSLIGPDLTPSVAGELLVSAVICDDFFVTGVSAPWTNNFHELAADGFADGYYINPPLSLQDCNFLPTTSSTSNALTGASFFPAPTGPSAKRKASMFFVL